jgi:hypothetical protein
MMGDITMLPQIVPLKLNVLNRSHAFGLVVSIYAGCVPLHKDWLFIFMRHQTWRYNIFVPQVVIVSKPTEWKIEKLML